MYTYTQIYVDGIQKCLEGSMAERSYAYSKDEFAKSNASSSLSLICVTAYWNTVGLVVSLSTAK